MAGKAVMGVGLDDLQAVILPILVYWLYSGMYTLLCLRDEATKERQGELGQHVDEWGDKKNSVTPWIAAKSVLGMQAVQILLWVLFCQIFSEEARRRKLSNYSPSESAIRFIAAMLIFDTWQYFCHRLMHNCHFLYKHVHSKHHRMVATFPIGALYTHPVEFLVVDSIGPLLGYVISGITPRASMFFFSLAIVRVIDDHCSRKLPWNPIQAFFWENSSCHQLHHQFSGYKYNFSSPFFLVWDKLLGTHVPYSLEPKEI